MACWAAEQRGRGKEIRENEKMEGKEKGGEDRVDEKESARGIRER